jgi:hypothetical protein
MPLSSDLRTKLVDGSYKSAVRPFPSCPGVESAPLIP